MQRFLMWTSCSFPTRPDPTDYIPLLSQYTSCYYIGSYCFLKLSCWRKASGADSESRCLGTHFGDFLRLRLSHVNKACWRQAKQKCVQVGYSAEKFAVFVQVNQTTVHSLVCISSAVLPLVTKQKPHCQTHVARWCKSENVTHTGKAHSHGSMCIALIINDDKDYSG